MQNISDIDAFNKMKTNGALFALFGGPRCSVCQSLRPQLTSMLEQHFPEIQSVYIDCEASPELGAQEGVFTLPVVKVYIEGMLIAEERRVFSIKQLANTIDRYYAMWKNSTVIEENDTDT